MSRTPAEDARGLVAAITEELLEQLTVSETGGVLVIVHTVLAVAVERPEIAREARMLLERIIGQTTGIPGEVIETRVRAIIEKAVQ